MAAMPKQEQSAESVRPGESSKAPRSLRVLVAEDDRDSALTLMMLLREEGHETTAVHSGRIVIRAISEFDPDVVILDIHQPEMSG